MISLPELLRRLRRAWAPPGPALARVAPPTDTTARLRAEIEPLLKAIAELQKSADSVRDNAENKAAQIVAEATAKAEQDVREAERSAPEARATAAKRRHEAVDEEIGQVMKSGEAEVARVQAVSAKRMAELADRVATCVLSGAGIVS